MDPSAIRPRAVAIVAATVLGLALVLAACVPAPRPGPARPRIGAATVLELPDAALDALRRDLHPLGAEARGSGAPLVDPEAGDCAATSLSLPGQEYRLAGGGGPFTAVDASGGGVDPSLIATPRAVAAQLRSTPGFAPPVRDVGLVVLDDFGSGPFGLDAKSVIDQLRAALAVLPAGASQQARNQALQARSDLLLARGDLSHGALVLGHTLALLQALGAKLTARDDVAGRYVAVLPGGNGRITVQARDIGALAHLSDVVTALRDAAASVAEGSAGVVVNMSFGAVPCGIGEDFALNRLRYPTFDDYARAVADLSANAATLDRAFGLALRADERLDLTRALLLRPVPGDPLDALLRSGERLVGVPVVPVASSGNYGLSYPLFPAAWPTVVAAGSRDAMRPVLDPLSVSNFSDAAEVVAGGAYFTLDGLRDPNAPATLPAILYAGTSFSAPAVALLSAVDLAQPAPRCGVARTGLPRLHGPADDSPLERAVPTRCLP